MATPDYTAGSVMDASAALLNDAAKQKYTYAVQLPYLRIALKELRELFELGNIPVTKKSSATLTVTAGITVINFVTIPALPSDLVTITEIWERATGVNPYVPMNPVPFIPHYLEGEPISRFSIWSWIGNEVNLPESNQDNDLKIDYVAQLFNTVADENTNIGIINGESFLHYRNAALCAKYIDEDEARSDSLNGEAGGALERGTGIEIKATQKMPVRHRPFRASYKRRAHGMR